MKAKKSWYSQAVIYQIDTSLFYDSNGDGCGDIEGITEKLQYIRRLGATTVWITPFYQTPFLDEGYDVTDHLQPDPRFGPISAFIEFVSQAKALGLRVIIELVIQHTSSQHPWFQQARRDKHSPYRDYYLWADEPDPNDDPPMFPGVEKSVWSWDDEAKKYYRHMFYHHEPDLNLALPAVVEEIDNIVLFWLKLGVSGFRLDAASHLTKQAGKGNEKEGYWILNHLRQLIASNNPQAIILGEVDVPVKEYRHYFGDGDRLHIALNFWLNKYFYVSLARKSARPMIDALDKMIMPPDGCCFANWLRNHDELDLEGISEADKKAVLNAFAPDKTMYVYQRGIRRRLAPMLSGNLQHLAVAHAILLSLPGVPVMRYGDEIGMGDDLRLEERYAVRTPMQWSSREAAGFSRAAPEKMIRAPISSGPWRYQQVNVEKSLLSRNSLLHRIIDMVNARAVLPEIGNAPFTIVRVEQASVLVILYQSETKRVLTLANFSDRPASVTLEQLADGYWEACLEDKRYSAPDAEAGVELGGYGYRWFSQPRD
ncbi:alpha-amylase family protein [Trabulsiella odontotermitis]|uniref:alpha-amylase family protein n=1 Tax=Trabulsiella odontotermitis TaxID=379893 RepID=UPI0024B868E9|nr:alpha-amylase family protein [Trabulsiella odontotermitis]WHP29450.1 alpha-amylase family protein [Trabulsiella odontotermitis]